jgi:adenylosuccinate lyase
LTRGQSIKEAVLIEFINTLDIPEQAKVALRTLRPDNYIGNAIEQARAV